MERTHQEWQEKIRRIKVELKRMKAHFMKTAQKFERYSVDSAIYRAKSSSYDHAIVIINKILGEKNGFIETS